MHNPISFTLTDSSPTKPTSFSFSSPSFDGCLKIKYPAKTATRRLFRTRTTMMMTIVVILPMHCPLLHLTFFRFFWRDDGLRSINEKKFPKACWATCMSAHVYSRRKRCGCAYIPPQAKPWNDFYREISVVLLLMLQKWRFFKKKEMSRKRKWRKLTFFCFHCSESYFFYNLHPIPPPVVWTTKKCVRLEMVGRALVVKYQ